MPVSLIAALILWMIVFLLKPFPFFWSMAGATSLLLLIALTVGRDTLPPLHWRSKDWLWGIGSALVLYGLFFLGNLLLNRFAGLWGVVPQKARYLTGIYQQGDGFSRLLKAVLLVFPIGLGEELFWRGYIQSSLQKRFSPGKAFLLTTAAYTAVHLPTLNPVLILAAMLCGLFWGALYWRTQSLSTVMISHMIWDPLIFVFFPIF